MSSSHILFCNESEKDIFGDPKWMLREGVQFKWFNKNYNNFAEFLSQPSHDKRKKIKQERKKIHDLGIYKKEQNELISKSAKLAYPIKDGIPILLESEARVINSDEDYS